MNFEKKKIQILAVRTNLKSRQKVVKFRNDRFVVNLKKNCATQRTPIPIEKMGRFFSEKNQTKNEKKRNRGRKTLAEK